MEKKSAEKEDFQKNSPPLPTSCRFSFRFRFACSSAPSGHKLPYHLHMAGGEWTARGCKVAGGRVENCGTNIRCLCATYTQMKSINSLAFNKININPLRFPALIFFFRTFPHIFNAQKLPLPLPTRIST